MNQTAWLESPYWLAAGWTFFHFLWIGILPWILAGVLRWMLRPARPQLRYLVALGLLLITASIPVGLFAFAVRSANELSSKANPQKDASSAMSGMTLKMMPVQRQAIPVVANPEQPSGTPRIGASMPLTLEWMSVLTERFVTVQSLACRWLPWVWLAGTPLILVGLACGINGAQQLRCSGSILHDGPIVDASRRLQVALNVGHHVAIIACDRIAAPILVGILRPAILLPSSVLTGFSPEQIEMVLLHELSHVRRWDNLVNLVQRVIEAGLFFHGVIWWLSNWVRLEREQCCDQIVVTQTGCPQVYAETLAAFALPGITPRHAAAAMADCHLVTRIRHILKLEDEIMHVSRTGFVALAGALMVAACFSVSLVQSRNIASAAEETPVAVSQERTAETPDATTPGQVEDLLRSVRQTNDTDLFVTQFLDVDGDILVPDGEAGKYRHLARKQRSAIRLWLDGASNPTAVVPQRWAPEQATGAPSLPDPATHGTAWCPATADGQEEWLELTYAEPIEPLVLVVYECLKPGALTRVIAYDAEGNELNAWIGKDPSPPDNGNGSAISVVPLKLKKIKIVRLRLYLDSPHVEGWNEIDAAGILDVKGAIHWATAATASSTWVPPNAETSATPDLKPGSESMLSRVLISGLQKTGAELAIETPDGFIDLDISAGIAEGLKQIGQATPNDAAQKLFLEIQQNTNDQRNGHAERVMRFEQRIKNLEAELAGLRESLQQLKTQPGKTNLGR